MLYSLKFFRTVLFGVKDSRLQGESKKSSAKEGFYIPIARRVTFKNPFETSNKPLWRSAGILYSVFADIILSIDSGKKLHPQPEQIALAPWFFLNLWHSSPKHQPYLRMVRQL